MDTPNDAKSDPSRLHLNETIPLQRPIEELEHPQLPTVGGTLQIQEEQARRIEKLNAEVARISAALQAREEAQTQSEQTLRAEIHRLVREIQEKNLILQNRNDELGRIKADQEALQERFKYPASATSRNEAAVSEDEGKNMRMESQAQLASLQTELSQKEQRAAASGINPAHREQTEIPRQRLTGTEAGVGPSADSRSFSVSDNRRWHSRYFWKRRWK